MAKAHGAATPPSSARDVVSRVVLAPGTLVPLLAVWTVVVLSAIFTHDLLHPPIDPLIAGVIFIVVLSAIVVASFGVVKEAEHLAKSLGEPYGTLVLTLSIVIIEVILISSVMLGPGESATIGRDSLFAVMMIILNGVMGISLLVGGRRHGQQAYNHQGASAYLGMIVVLTLLALVLPNFTSSTDDGSFSLAQAIGLSLVSAVVYAYFLALQVGKHKRLFVQEPAQVALPTSSDPSHPASAASASATPFRRTSIVTHSALLVVTVLPIILLSHDLATLLDYGIELVRAPVVLSGVLIAAIVFTPEAATAVRASLNNETQRTINLGLGAFVSTLGLTIPAVLIIGLLTGKHVILGESPANMLLIVATIALSFITFTSKRTTSLHGALHLLLFAVFAILIFAP